MDDTRWWGLYFSLKYFIREASIFHEIIHTSYAAVDPGFPRGRRPGVGEGRQHTILPYFPENCMKLKEFGHPGGGAHLLRPLKSATGMNRWLPLKDFNKHIKSLYRKYIC